ncbi:MAG: exonuclease SbcCD subunit D C-terminal domain-containing protein [Zoogloeaceae bacterium]|jgi:exonuclease SbcD|nr:exonuclease SbcCD subunit D C-terminal domain-containing protein [Zoogloeaceae bacterium]
MLTLLHTSDWHLGRALYGRKRHDEFAAFLDWLVDTMRQESADILVVAGDIFDSAAPTNQAQALYYDFLCRVAAGAVCRHVVVIAGNHDSPSFLDAPGELLKTLDVHVVGRKRDDPADEVLVLKTPDGAPEAIVCAVPYLREKDLREVEAGENATDKETKLLEGLRAHYARVVEIAGERRGDLDIPLIATGHLFTAGGKTREGDGVRELYVGSLAHAPPGIFPARLDYVALGHLHLPQAVRGHAHIRYSGAPLAMGFSEAGQQKSVCRVTFDGRTPTVAHVPVPVFRELACVEGDRETIARRLEALRSAGQPVWLEIIHTGEAPDDGLRAHLETFVEGTALDILRIRNPRRMARFLAARQSGENLEDLDPEEVFTRCLEAHAIPETERAALRETYREACFALHDADVPTAVKS